MNALRLQRVIELRHIRCIHEGIGLRVIIEQIGQLYQLLDMCRIKSRNQSGRGNIEVQHPCCNLLLASLMTAHRARRKDIDLDIPFAQFSRPFEEEKADIMPDVGQSL